MAKMIGYMRCPVCGRRTDIRVNKNGTLYCNCVNYHQAKLNKPDSIDASSALEEGKSWNNGLIYLYPYEKTAERAENGQRNIENSITSRTNDSSTGTTGSSTGNYGRNDGQFAAVATVDNGKSEQSDDWDGECGMF